MTQPLTTVTGYTADRMKAIEDASLVSATVDATSGDLIVTRHDGTTFDAGHVVGAKGTTGNTGATGPAGPSGAIVGEIKEYTSLTIPSGYLLCNGAAVSRTTYAALFAVCGTTYGAGDGSTTFNLPNRTNRFGRGNTPGPGGGADTHSHTSSAHFHTLSDAGQAQVSGNAGTNMGARTVTSGSWTEQWRMTGTSGSASSRTAGAALMGQTDSATAPDTGLSSNIPAYTGFVYIIKT